MGEGILVALITTGGAVLTGGVTTIVVALINRRPLKKVVAEVTNNGGSSLKDAVARIETSVTRIVSTQQQHGERLAAVETRLSDHLHRYER
jgi:hypothetical protein